MQDVRKGTRIGDAIVGKFSPNQALTKVGVLFTEPDIAKRLFPHVAHLLVAVAAGEQITHGGDERLVAAH